MKRLIPFAFSVLSSAVALAVDPRAFKLITDPSQMVSTDSAGTSAFVQMSDVLPFEMDSFTAMVWLRMPLQTDTAFSRGFTQFMVSPETADKRIKLPNLIDDKWLTNKLPLTNGRWSATCLPSTYDLPSDFGDYDGWRYGCFCYNIKTDKALTLNIGGAEVSIPASNGWQVANIKAVSASRAVSIAASSTSANVFFGIAVQPMHQFCGGSNQAIDSSGGSTLLDPDIGIHKTWTLMVYRAKIEGGNCIVKANQLTATRNIHLDDWTQTTALWKPRNN